MKNKIEIESELISITETYKRNFSEKFERSEDLMTSTFNKWTLYSSMSFNLMNDLSTHSKTYYKKYDKQIPDDTINFMVKCFDEFHEFVSKLPQ